MSVVWRYVGSVLFLFLFPLLTAALFALPAYLLHFYSAVSVLVYLGEIAGALFLLFRRQMLVRSGVSLKICWSDIIWSMLYSIFRTAAWIVLIPIVAVQASWLVLLPRVLFVVFLTAPAEELHFRGLLLSSLQQMSARRLTTLGSIVLAAFLSSFLFGLLHMATYFSAGWLWLLVFLADGLAYCALRIKSNSLFPPFLAHVAINILTASVFIGGNVPDTTVLLYQAVVILTDLVFFSLVLGQVQMLERRKEKVISSLVSPQGGNI